MVGVKGKFSKTFLSLTLLGTYKSKLMMKFLYKKVIWGLFDYYDILPSEEIIKKIYFEVISNT